MQRTLGLLCAYLAVACAFVRPSSPETFRRYLIGNWQVKKRYVYRSGGMSGTWKGEASFRMLDVMASPALLTYNESGTFTPGGVDTGKDSATTRNRLLYDFSSPLSAEVFYDLLPDEERFSTNAVVSAASYLYSLTPQYDGRMTIEQLRVDGGDAEYSGSMEIEAPNAFISTWHVRGSQAGEIVALYQREMDNEDL